MELVENIITWEYDSTRVLVLEFGELINIYYKTRDESVANEIETLLQHVLPDVLYLSIRYSRYYKNIHISNVEQIQQNNTVVGTGRASTVYSAGEFVIKVVKEVGDYESRILKVLRETVLLQGVTPCIINSYQHLKDSDKCYTVLEKMDTDLWRYLKTGNSIKGIILQVIFTLTVLQSTYPGFRHNDLKIDNILLSLNRDKDLSLQCGGTRWRVPKEVPLAKIADFDYSNILDVCDNNDVFTRHTRSFGCDRRPNKIYDLHIFLNSLYSKRDLLDSDVVDWLHKELPVNLRGGDTKYIKFGRLREPDKHIGKIRTPDQLLECEWFDEFKSSNQKIEYYSWGVE